MSFLDETIQKFEGNLHPLQLREVLAHLSYINVNLKERPVFHSNYTDKQQIIDVTLPESPPQLVDEELQQFQIGDFLASFAEGHMRDLENKQVLLDEIIAGKRGYLFDMNGDFFNMEM